MRLQTRFQMLTAISLGTVLVLVAILGWTLRERAAAESADRLAESLNQELVERAMIRQEFFLHREGRSRELWERKTRRIQGLLELAGHAFPDGEARNDLEDVRKSFTQSNAFFKVLVDELESGSPGLASAAATEAFRTRLVDQALLANYQLFDGSRRLSEGTSARLEVTHQRTMFVVYVLAASVLLLTVLTLAVINRVLQQGLARLQQGTARVAAGDLASRLDLKGRDELAELGRSFDAMTSRLEGATCRLEEEIQERRQAEQRVARLNAELDARILDLQASNRELESFSYSVSHDLRAPLRHIAGFLDLLREHLGEKLDGEGDRYLRIVNQAARKMANLIDDLLTYSRLGRTELITGLVDQDALVREAIEVVAGNLAGRAITWDVATLPPVHGDATLLRAVWQNLLSNAVKFTRGRTPGRIQIGVEEVGGEICCFVRDNGVGFDMQYKAKLFSVFQRLHSGDEFEGTGIGLANVRRMIERQGGRVWAEGEPGLGATFWFALPAPEVAT